MIVRTRIAGHEVIITTIDNWAMINVMNKLGQVHGAAAQLEQKREESDEKLAAFYDTESMKFYDIADKIENSVTKRIEEKKGEIKK